MIVPLPRPMGLANGERLSFLLPAFTCERSAVNAYLVGCTGLGGIFLPRRESRWLADVLAATGLI
jgi:hypothetical protein